MTVRPLRHRYIVSRCFFSEYENTHNKTNLLECMGLGLLLRRILYFLHIPIIRGNLFYIVWNAFLFRVYTIN